MPNKNKKKGADLNFDWDYINYRINDELDDEWLTVYVPYIGTYEALDSFVQDYLNDTYEEDIRCHIQDTSLFDKIDAYYTMDLGKYNEDWVETVKDLLSIDKLYFIKMLSPKEYNFSTDKLVAQIKREAMWKLYEYVKDTPCYAQEVKEATTSYDGYIPYYNELDFYFVTKDDWNTNYSPAILSLIMKAALHKKLEMDADNFNVEMELFMRQNEHKHILEYINLSTLYRTKGENVEELEF